MSQISPSIKKRGPEQKLGVTFFESRPSLGALVVEYYWAWKFWSHELWLRGLVRILGILGKGHHWGRSSTLICNNTGKEQPRTGMGSRHPWGPGRKEVSDLEHSPLSPVFEMKWTQAFRVGLFLVLVCLFSLRDRKNECLLFRESRISGLMKGSVCIADLK